MNNNRAETAPTIQSKVAESWGYVAGRYPTARDQAIRRKTSHSVQCIRIGIPKILPIFTDTGFSFRLPPKGLGLYLFPNRSSYRSAWSPLRFVGI